MTKTYTIEVTADELDEWWRNESGDSDSSLDGRLSKLAEQVRVDRGDDVRFPWKAYNDHGTWRLGQNGGWPGTKRAACLASAAPELLEAVKAVESWWSDVTEKTGTYWTTYMYRCEPLIKRALAKVETGVPE